MCIRDSSETITSTGVSIGHTQRRNTGYTTHSDQKDIQQYPNVQPEPKIKHQAPQLVGRVGVHGDLEECASEAQEHDEGSEHAGDGDIYEEDVDEEGEGDEQHGGDGGGGGLGGGGWFGVV